MGHDRRSVKFPWYSMHACLFSIFYISLISPSSSVLFLDFLFVLFHFLCLCSFFRIHCKHTPAHVLWYVAAHKLICSCICIVTADVILVHYHFSAIFRNFTSKINKLLVLQCSSSQRWDGMSH